MRRNDDDSDTANGNGDIRYTVRMWRRWIDRLGIAMVSVLVSTVPVFSYYAYTLGIRLDKQELITDKVTNDHEQLQRLSQSQQIMLTQLSQTPSADMVKARVDGLQNIISANDLDRKEMLKALHDDVQSMRTDILGVMKELHQHELTTSAMHNRR